MYKISANERHCFVPYFTRVTLRMMREGDVLEINLPSSRLKISFIFPASI